MEVAVIVIFLVLIFLMGMRAWFMVKHDKTGKLSFWDAVNKIVDEDSLEQKSENNERS